MKLQNYNLGEFEELVLLIVAVLDSSAYGISVREEVLSQTNRSLSLSAIHSVLNRLEKKKYLTSQMGGETKERGGRRKRFFKVTGLGREALSEMRSTRNRLWGMIPDISMEQAR